MAMRAKDANICNLIDAEFCCSFTPHCPGTNPVLDRRDNLIRSGNLARAGSGSTVAAASTETWKGPVERTAALKPCVDRKKMNHMHLTQTTPIGATGDSIVVWQTHGLNGTLFSSENPEFCVRSSGPPTDAMIVGGSRSSAWRSQRLLIPARFDQMHQ